MDNVEENISNFDECCKFFERELSHSELYECLKSGSLAEKQLACVRIESCTCAEEAEILMQNLTGIDGKVREAVSFKLKTFLPECKELFLRKDFYEIFLNSIIDINGNICRNVIIALQHIANIEDFYNYAVPEIITRSHDVINKIESFCCKDRKYVTNKEVFKLYWYLETLSIFPITDTEELFGLLKRCASIEEYTIREKTARLLLKLPAEYKLDGLNFDNNFYVNLALGK